MQQSIAEPVDGQTIKITRGNSVQISLTVTETSKQALYELEIQPAVEARTALVTASVEEVFLYADETRPVSAILTLSTDAPSGPFECTAILYRNRSIERRVKLVIAEEIASPSQRPLPPDPPPLSDLHSTNSHGTMGQPTGGGGPSVSHTVPPADGASSSHPSHYTPPVEPKGDTKQDTVADAAKRQREAEQLERVRREAERLLREKEEKDRQEAIQKQQEAEAEEKRKSDQQEAARIQREKLKQEERERAEAAEAAKEAAKAASGSGTKSTPVRVVRSPMPGHRFELRPGEVVEVVFPYRNIGIRPQTYVLTTDPVPGGWIKSHVPEANIEPGSEDQLSFRIAPPPNTGPTRTDFTVRVGPRDGNMEQPQFTVVIRATPAVALEAEQTSVAVFSRRSRIQVPITIRQAGNCHTAFRLTPVDKNNHTTNGDDTWGVYVENEMATIKTSEPALSANIRVERRSPWWFGWVEKRTFRLHAVPVTDPGNAGHTHNTLDLTVKRWRILPFAWPINIALLFFWLALNADPPQGLTVTNAVYQDSAAHVYYVVGNPGNSDGKVTTNLRWDRGPFTLTKLYVDNQSAGIKTGKTGTNEVPFAQPDPTKKKSIVEVTNLAGKGETITVYTLNSRPETPLVLLHQETKQKLSPSEYRLDIPRNGKPVRFVVLNTTKRGNDLRLAYITVKRPSNDDYSIVGLGQEENDAKPLWRLLQSTKTVEEASLDWIRVSAKRSDVKPAELVFVTSDDNQKTVTIKLNPVGSAK